VKIGYPCINRTLECLANILEYNIAHNILFFRISSDLVPFASHPVCKVRWQKIFKADLEAIGGVIKRHKIRISMHPGQFTLINSREECVFRRSLKELRYHTEVLDLMGLGEDAKIQVHVGGVYGDKEKSVERFVRRYRTLPVPMQRRLVIENDERSYSVQDCLKISQATGIPVLFDVFHDSILGSGKTAKEAIRHASASWRGKDGLPMVDYSSQQRRCRAGAHARSIDPVGFVKFLKETKPLDFDIMLEIKDKEASALKAIEIALNDKRFLRGISRLS